MPGVEVKEKAGTIQLPEEFSTVSLVLANLRQHHSLHKIENRFRQQQSL